MSSCAVIACGALAADVSRIARARGWDIDVHPVVALLHNRPEQIAPAVAALSDRLRDRGYDTIALAYGDCGTDGALDDLGLPRIDAANCYEMLARNEVRAALQDQPGTYFLTDFLARTFEHTVVRQLGLDRHPELRDDYFRHYTRVVWLAQRPTPATRAAAERAAARIELPLSEVPVGNTGLERQLEALLASSSSVATSATRICDPAL